MQRRACTYQAQELEVDVEAMIRRTDPLGHREAAGIVVDLFKDWSQFCKEWAIQFYCASRSAAKVSVVAPGPQARRPGSP
jgi:hypothetical protein